MNPFDDPTTRQQAEDFYRRVQAMNQFYKGVMTDLYADRLRRDFEHMQPPVKPVGQPRRRARGMFGRAYRWVRSRRSPPASPIELEPASAPPPYAASVIIIDITPAAADNEEVS